MLCPMSVGKQQSNEYKTENQHEQKCALKRNQKEKHEKKKLHKRIARTVALSKNADLHVPGPLGKQQSSKYKNKAKMRINVHSKETRKRKL